MFTGPKIAALFLTVCVWCTSTTLPNSQYTVLYAEAKQSTVSTRGIGLQPGLTASIAASTLTSDSNSISNSPPLDATASASGQQNHITGLSDVAFQDDRRSRATERHKNLNATAATASPGSAVPKASSKPGSTQTDTSAPTKPRRHKSHAPTPSPTTMPHVGDDAMDDDTAGDDTVPAATSKPSDFASPAADMVAPVPVPVPTPLPVPPPSHLPVPPPSPLPVPPPTPFPVHPVPQTKAPSVQTHAKTATYAPSEAYVPIDDDPIVSQDIQKEEEKEAEEVQQVQTEAKTVGGIGFLLALMAMIFTAHQMSENPDGIYASVCRLAITVIGCALKLILMPCRNFMGNRYHAGHIPVSTMEYREPYRGGHSAMEMT